MRAHAFLPFSLKSSASMFRACYLAGLFWLLAPICFTQNPATSAAPAVPSPPSSPVRSAPPEPAVSGPAKITFSQCHVDGPYIAMTFDDGPHAENTPRLLDMLKKRNIKATFFVVGECAAQYPHILKRIAAEGHEIGNHSWSHPLLSKMGEEGVTAQLQRTHDVIVEVAGVTPKVMRPPYGGLTPNQRNWANKKWGYKIILWDVDPLDWKYRNAAHVQAEILKQTVTGSIVLSHDIHKSTVDAMPETLDALAAKGFKFITVSELVAMDRPVPPKARTAPGGTPPAQTPVENPAGNQNAAGPESLRTAPAGSRP
jgi:peptidoglycan/xylan/chitin deacetylase (PgdA/CDA1 family)